MCVCVCTKVVRKGRGADPARMHQGRVLVSPLACGKRYCGGKYSLLALLSFLWSISYSYFFSAPSGHINHFWCPSAATSTAHYYQVGIISITPQSPSFNNTPKYEYFVRIDINLQSQNPGSLVLFLSSPAHHAHITPSPAPIPIYPLNVHGGFSVSLCCFVCVLCAGCK